MRCGRTSRPRQERKKTRAAQAGPEDARNEPEPKPELISTRRLDAAALKGDEMAVSANRLELLQIADAVAREKSIDKQIVIAAMADAIQKAARSRYGQETNIRADINPTPAR